MTFQSCLKAGAYILLNSGKNNYLNCRQNSFCPVSRGCLFQHCPGPRIQVQLLSEFKGFKNLPCPVSWIPARFQKLSFVQFYGFLKTYTVQFHGYSLNFPFGSGLGQRRFRENKLPQKVQKITGLSEKTGDFLARRKGFEPLTFWSVARRSIQLS